MSAYSRIFSVLFVLLWVVVAALGLSRFSIQNDMQVFLPRGETGNLAQSLIGHNPQSQILLLAIEGDDSAALAATSHAFTAKLSAMQSITQAINGANTSDQATLDRLFAYRYHLAPQAERYSAEAMTDYLQQAHGRLSGSDGWMLSEYLPQDPSGAFDALIRAWQHPAGSAIPTAHGVWLNESAGHAYIIAYMQNGEFNADDYRQQLHAIEQAFAQVSDGQKLLLSSPYSIALKTNDAISHEAMMLSIVATTLLLVWLAFLFRSAKHIALLMVPVLGASVFAMACVILVYGSIHGITLAFGITLLGLTVDYPIHVLSHAQSKIRPVMKLLLLGVATTCIGFGAMLLSSLPGLQQLGAFILCGLFAAWGWTNLLANALSQGRLHLPAPVRTPQHRFSWQRLCMLNGLLIAASLGFMAMQQGVWNDDVTTIMPAAPELLEQDKALRQELQMGNGRYFLAVGGQSADAALQRSVELAPLLVQWISSAAITSYDMAARYLPSKATQQARLAALPETATLQSQIDQAIATTDFAPEAFAGSARAMTEAASQPDIQRTDLPPLLQARVEMLMHENNEGHIALVALSGIEDAEGLHAQIVALGDADIAFIDLKYSIGDMMQGFRKQALHLCFLGCAVLSVLLMLVLRDIRKTLLVLCPIAAALCLVPALLLAAGQLLTLFHLMALLLVAGVGLDYMLFRYLSPPDEQRHVTRAIFACAITTLLVFTILSFSSVPALHIMGITVVLGTAYIMLWCLIFPPNRVV